MSHITLIGMSNIGKSHWSKKLAALRGMERIECDTLITEKLGLDLQRHGHADLNAMAAWMGQPYEARYAETSHVYIEAEKQVMRDVLARMQNDNPLIVDTTGSVVYAGDDIAEQLRAHSRVVYLEAADDHIAHLFKDYAAHPKPVIWGESFNQRDGEDNQTALKRCYPDLLHFRAARYKEMAHTIIPYVAHRAHNADLSAYFS